MNSQNKQKKYSIVHNIITSYFLKLIKINQFQQNSTIYVIITEILRFLLGHSQVFCIFMPLAISNGNQEQLFYTQINQLFQNHVMDYYLYVKLIYLAIFSFQIFYVVILFWLQKISKKIKIISFLYYFSRFIKISSQMLFSIYAIVLYTSIQQNQLYISITLIISMMLTIVFFIISSLFQHKNIFQSRDSHTHNQNIGVQFQNIGFCVISFIGTYAILKNVNFIIRYAIIIVWIALQAARMKSTVFWPYYLQTLTHKLYSFVSCLQSVQILVFTLYDLTKIDLIRDNIFFLQLFITIYWFWACLNYSSFIKQKSIFIEADELKNKEQFYLMMNSYYKILQSLQKHETFGGVDLIVSSIRKNHQNECKNSACFCHSNQQMYNFMRHYILYILNKFQDLYSNNKTIMLYIYSYRFHVYHSYTKLHEYLNFISKNRQLNYLQQMMCMNLQNKVKLWLDKTNKQNKVIRICLAIKLQKDMTIINQTILESIEIKYKKWHSLSKQLCRIDQIKNYTHKQLDILIKIQQIKIKKWSQYNRSFAFNAIIYFYFKRIQLKNDQLTQLQQNIKDLNRKVKQEQFFKTQLFQKHLFNANSCSLQTSLKTNSVGLIINVSKSISKVFGHDPRKIIGENMSCLYPRFLSQQRMTTIHQWIKNGGDIKKLSKVTEDYCLHKNNCSFVALKYQKLFVTLKQITLITTFFKKNQNDLILVDDHFLLQSNGKLFQNIIGHVPLKTQIKYIFKDLKQKLSNAQIDIVKKSHTIIFNQATIKQFLNTKVSNQKIAQREQNLVKKQSHYYQIINKTEIWQNVWRMHFNYKKCKIHDTQFYCIEGKVIQFVKKITDQGSKLQNKNGFKSNNSILENSIESVTENLQNQEQRCIEIQEQQNSSMTSFNSQLGYQVSNLIKFFYEILLYPQRVNDKKMRIQYILNILFYIILLGLVTTALVLNKYSLDDKTLTLKANTRIGEVLTRLQVSTNHLYNLYMYKNNDTLSKLAYQQLEWDFKKFMSQMSTHFEIMNSQTTPLKGQVLYEYLKTPVTWISLRQSNKTVQLLQFFKIVSYIIIQTKDHVSNSSSSIYQSTDLYKLLTLNLNNYRSIRNYLASLTQAAVLSDQQFNKRILIIFIVIFFITSLAIFIYVNWYRKFRFSQIQNHIKIYQLISNDNIIDLSNYYYEYYRHYNLGKSRIDSALMEQNSKIYQVDFEMNNQLHAWNLNKVKFVGQQGYFLWVVILLAFIILNTGNSLIAYNMFKFNNQMGYFSRLTNSISQSQSNLINRLFRLKGQYYFSSQTLNQSFIDIMLSRIQINEVAFNANTTLDSNWVFDSDDNFRQQFNKILTTSSCQLNKDMFDLQQLKICNQYTALGKNGIIVILNSLSRVLRNTYLYWRSHIPQILNATDYLANRTQFLQFDFGLTFQLDTLTKLSQKLIQVYEAGFMVQYKNCILILIGVLLILLLGFGWKLYKYHDDKKQLSYLYGYTLLFPPEILKKSKYILKFVQQNLQFSQKY